MSRRTSQGGVKGNTIYKTAGKGETMVDEERTREGEEGEEETSEV